MAILPSQRTSRVPQFRSPLLPSLVTTQHMVFPKGYLVRIYHAWSLFLILSMFSSTVHLADTPPHSRTTLAYESITHTSTINSTHAIYGEADCAPTCAYRLPSFPFVNLAHPNIALSHCFFPNVALDPPSSSPPPYPCRHVFVASIAVSTSVHHFSSSSKHHPWSIIICPRQMTGPSYSPSTSSTCITPATRSATVTPTQVTLTSTIANAATTMTPSGVARPLSWPCSCTPS